MNDQVQIIAILVSILVMLLVFHLIRRKKLREEYAILWFFASMGLLVTSLWRNSIDWAARLVGVAYPPSLLLLAFIIFGFLLALHYSISLSRLSEHTKRLTQELALLKLQLEQEGRGSMRDTNQNSVR